MKLKLENLQKKSVWIAVASLVAMAGKVFGVYEVPEGFNGLVDLALTVLTMAGILIDG